MEYQDASQDLETGKYDQIIGHGRSAHYFHRILEGQEVSRQRAATTYNRMQEMIEPQDSYEEEARPNFPTDIELETAADLLSKEESIEKAATRALRAHLLGRKTGKMEMEF